MTDDRTQADFRRFFSSWKIGRKIISGEFPRLRKAENGNEYGVLAFLGKASITRRVRRSRYLESWETRLSHSRERYVEFALMLP